MASHFLMFPSNRDNFVANNFGFPAFFDLIKFYSFAKV